MTVIRELVEVLEERYTLSEIVELLSDFDKEDLQNFAIQNNICPKCFDILTVHKWKEPSEHFGFPCREEMSELICVGCGEAF